MATPTVYVFCDQNCKFEGMTKEQILTAIAQAVATGEIMDIDTGFVQTIKTVNGLPLKFFVGEQSAYDELTEEEKQNLFAIITNDTTASGILAAVEELAEELRAVKNDLKQAKDNLFNNPIRDQNILLEAGFYYVGCSKDNITLFSFGVIYWDSTWSVVASGVNNDLTLIAAANSGYLQLFDSANNEVTEEYGFYISKLW